jgi:hypothetical protein
MKFVMLLLLLTPGQPVLVQQEFNSMRACNDAKTIILSLNTRGAGVSIPVSLCLPLD